MMKILTLGPQYSFSDSATKKYLEKAGIDGETELFTPPDRTEGIIGELARRYDGGNFDAIAVVPVLNTLEGRVKETIGPGRGLIRYHPKVKICGEYWFEIEQCLAGKRNLRDISTVVSHPQALGQCKGYLQSLGVKTGETRSTSEAAEIAAKDETGKIAAICSEDAAKGYGLEVLAKGIADKFGGQSENWTRFFVLSGRDAEPTGYDKTTLTMELMGAEKSGTLQMALQLFSDSGTNLSYIESMMKGSRTEYVFWLDVDRHNNSLGRELAGLGRITKWLRVHGSYPTHTIR